MSVIGGISIVVSIPYRYKQNDPEHGFLKPYLHEFQSPIGTNKTIIIRKESVQQEQVSIPYRYKQNIDMVTSGMDEERAVSIPYRYKQNTRLDRVKLGLDPEFQSPIGTNKTNNATTTC